MSAIENLNKAAKQYCEEIAFIDIQSGAINGSMKTVQSNHAGWNQQEVRK